MRFAVKTVFATIQIFCSTSLIEAVIHIHGNISTLLALRTVGLEPRFLHLAISPILYSTWIFVNPWLYFLSSCILPVYLWRQSTVCKVLCKSQLTATAGMYQYILYSVYCNRHCLGTVHFARLVVDRPGIKLNTKTSYGGGCPKSQLASAVTNRFECKCGPSILFTENDLS